MCPGARGEKISHLFKRSESNDPRQTYLHISAPTNLQYESLWKNDMENGNKEYNEKYICCFFIIWNLKNAITYNCGRVVLSRTLIYFAISTFILLIPYSFHVLSIILSKVWFYIVRFTFPFVVNQMTNPFFFFFQKYFFALIILLQMVTFIRRWKQQHCFNVVKRCSCQRWNREPWFDVVQHCSISTVTFLTLPQRWFDLVRCRDVISP